MNLSDVFCVSTAFALAGLLTGCVAKKPVEPADPRRGDVAIRTIEQTAAETYPPPDKHESYDSPVPFDESAAPQYPASLLVQHLPPVSIKVRVIVDESGSVTQVSPLDLAATADPSFFASIDATVRSWKFSPLVKFGKGAGSTTIKFHGREQTYEGAATALPFHRDYEFTFAQRDGEGFVSTSHHD